MNTPSHFTALLTACLPRIQAYHDDLRVHDLAAITEHPERPFIHLTREYGTYLTMMPPAAAYPAEGEEIPYLFGHADREHLLKEYAGSIAYGETHHPEALLHYFDGKNLRQITHAQAREIMRQYVDAIRSAWRIESAARKSPRLCAA